jgi:hypothetical protein
MVSRMLREAPQDARPVAGRSRCSAGGVDCSVMVADAERTIRARGPLLEIVTG